MRPNKKYKSQNNIGSLWIKKYKNKIIKWNSISLPKIFSLFFLITKWITPHKT